MAKEKNPTVHMGSESFFAWEGLISMAMHFLQRQKGWTQESSGG